MQAEGLKDNASGVTLIIQAESFIDSEDNEDNASGGQLVKFNRIMLFYSLNNVIKFN